MAHGSLSSLPALAFIKILFVIITASKVTNINHRSANRIFSARLEYYLRCDAPHLYSPHIVLSAINNLRDTTGFIVD